jgi:hypothetical protein
MQIHRKHFPEVIPDNDMVYLAHLQGVIDSIDELSSMEITRTPHSYHFRIATSLPKYNNLLLEELLKLHNLFQIKMNMSKSIKSSATIVYEIEIS